MSTNVVTDARKFLVAAAGILAQVLAAGLLHGTALHWTQVAAAAVAAVLVYLVPNGANLPSDVKAALAGNDTGAGTPPTGGAHQAPVAD